MSDLSGGTPLWLVQPGPGAGIIGAFAKAGAPVVAVAPTGPASRAGHHEPRHPDRGRGCGRCDGGAEPAGPVRAAGAHCRRRRQTRDASAPGPDVGDVLRQLAHRRQDRLHLAARATAAAAAAWQQGVVVSSGATINGSPASSGGYAGSKATQRCTAGELESRGGGLDLTVTTVLSRMTPCEDVGRRGCHRSDPTHDGRDKETPL
jgi:hypothetical protein